MKIKIFDQSFSKFCVLLKEIKENQKKNNNWKKILSGFLKKVKTVTKK